MARFGIKQPPARERVFRGLLIHARALRRGGRPVATRREEDPSAPGDGFARERERGDRAACRDVTRSLRVRVSSARAAGCGNTGNRPCFTGRLATSWIRARDANRRQLARLRLAAGPSHPDAGRSMPVAHARVPVVPARLDPRRSAFVGAGREGLPRLRSRAFPPRPAPRAPPMASSTRSPLLGAMDPAIVGDRGPLHVRTPLLLSQPMSAALGRDVYVKLDALQPSGSFKLRGIGYACQAAVRRGATTLVSSSGGNAGLAVAYSGQRLGAPVAVVVPETTPSSSATGSGRTARTSSSTARSGPRRTPRRSASPSAQRRPRAPVRGRDHLDRPRHRDPRDRRRPRGARRPPDRIRPSAVRRASAAGLLAGVLRGLREVGWR